MTHDMSFVAAVTVGFFFCDDLDSFWLNFLAGLISLLFASQDFYSCVLSSQNFAMTHKFRINRGLCCSLNFL